MKGCHIIEAPSGRFVLAGRVPIALAYDCPEELYAVIQRCGPGIARMTAKRNGWTFRTLSYTTRDEAQKALDTFAKTV